MQNLRILSDLIQSKFGVRIQSSEIVVDELTVELASHDLVEVCRFLRDEPSLQFEMLMDLCGVDYSEYGISEWRTIESTKTGFSRGVEEKIPEIGWQKPRFAVVYHLLSIQNNHRIRIRAFADGEPPIMPSVVDLWRSADWYEREAFDLFGILFEGHPDLRRILTDYGFIGHPFRKDFPLIGNVEMRYSAKDQRVVYEPVSIKPRTLVPKTIRDDHPRFVKEE
jgi:NADH-quinone oxidoreductase subunit C